MEDLKDLYMKKNLWPLITSNLRFTFGPHLGLAMVLLLITPLLFGIENLDAAGSAAPLEMLVALSGVLLLTPVFMPESKPEVEAVVASRAVSCTVIWALRLLYSVLSLAVLIGLFGMIMRLGHCDISVKMLAGTMAGALFLGAAGLLTNAVFNNVAVSYMIPMIIYAASFSGPKVMGHFWLFSMTAGQYDQKLWLLGGAVVLTAAAFLVKAIKRRSA